MKKLETPNRRVTFTIEPAMLERLEEIAAGNHGLSISWMVRRAVADFVAAYEQRECGPQGDTK
jgi:predicted transcriptional regulator